MNTLNLILNTINIDAGQGAVWFFVFGIPIALAVSFYTLMYKFYRNTDKNYNYEKETHVKMYNVQNVDIMVGTNNGTTERYIKSRNDNNHRFRVTRVPVEKQLPPTTQTPPLNLPTPAQAQPEPTQEIPDSCCHTCSNHKIFCGFLL